MTTMTTMTMKTMRTIVGPVPSILLLWLGACAGAVDSGDDDASASFGSTDGDSSGDPTEDSNAAEATSMGDGSTGNDSGSEDTGDESGDDTTGGAPLENDDDSIIAPAVVAQFRVTAASPVVIDGPLFNEDPIDTRGVQYVGAIAADDDPSDHLRFSIVPGEVDPYLRVTLDCDTPQVRVAIARDGELLDTVVCGDDQTNVLLHDASSFDDFDVTISSIDPAQQPTDYVLSLDAFCSGGCDYEPYAP